MLKNQKDEDSNKKKYENTVGVGGVIFWSSIVDSKIIGSIKGVDYSR